MNRLSLIIIICLLIVSGCSTTTTLVSVQNSSYRGARFKSIVVMAPYDDLIRKKKVETLIRSALSSDKLKVFRAIDILPPLKEYTVSEVRDSLKSAGAEVLLVVGVTDFWKTFYTTPGHSETTSEKKTSYNPLSNSSVEKGKSATTYFPGITLSQSNVKLDVRLLKYGLDEVPETIWRSSSQTSGNFLTSDSKVMRDAARQIAVQLISDGILSESSMASQTGSMAKRIMLRGGADQLVELGCFSCNDFDMASVYNKYGIFGSSAKASMWDPCGIYATPQSEYSACNPDAKYPPVIINGLGEIVGILSINESIEFNYKNLKIQTRENNYKAFKLRKWLLKEICLECNKDSL